MVCSRSARRCGRRRSEVTAGQRIAPAIGPTRIGQPGKGSPAASRMNSTAAWVTSRMRAMCSDCSMGPNHRIRRESNTERKASSEYAKACWPSSTPLPASTRRPSIQPTPMPTRRGWRTHQKASTKATKSGTSRRSGHGRKARKSAIAKEPKIVLMRTGSRICELLGIIARRLLRCALVLGLGATRLLASPVLRLALVRSRRPCRLAAQYEHVASALDAGRRLADDAGEAVLLVALDAYDGRDRESRRVSAVYTGGHKPVAVLHFRIGRHVAQLDHP